MPYSADPVALALDEQFPSIVSGPGPTVHSAIEPIVPLGEIVTYL
jgi:hypothetical protein